MQNKHKTHLFIRSTYLTWEEIWSRADRTWREADVHLETPTNQIDLIGDEETLFSLTQAKKFLKIQESSIKLFFTVIVDSNNTRIDNIFKEVQAIWASLEYTQAELADLKKINCQKRLESIESTVNILIEKADDLENRSRRNNLCFEGIDETGYDNWEKSEEKVIDLISSQPELDTKDIVIVRAHHVGKKRSGSKPRPIIAKFLCYKCRK